MRVDKIHPDFQRQKEPCSTINVLSPRTDRETRDVSDASGPKTGRKVIQENWLQALSERVRQLNETLRIFDKDCALTSTKR